MWDGGWGGDGGGEEVSTEGADTVIGREGGLEVE